ncbi:histone deacetylase domain-containing protein [Lipomyces oligophaga]|uniref:histone deacetylase domain-containing protein n=1 Tax=Lipomyces oligophaga TaxID=45792 RepID=UPI0034CF3CE4
MSGLSIDQLPQSDLPKLVSDKTLVLLSPLSYLHVFSRQWVAKRYLASIVERPQRLNATALGISAALTLAGAENNFVLDSSSKSVDLASAEHVKRVHGANWPTTLRTLCEASAAKLDKLELEVPETWNSGDIYLGPGTISALEGVVGAIETGIDRVFDADPESENRCFICIRPPGHHSHPCTPSGFCLLNNVHIGIQYAAAKHGLTHAVILDFDLHHGDGSQDICWKLSGLEEQDEDFYSKPASETSTETNPNAEIPNPKIGYFSLHDVNSFPTEVGYATAEMIKDASIRLMAHNMCIWNIHLEPYSTPQEFDELYKSTYSDLFRQARRFLNNARIEAKKSNVPFKAAVFISAGFDASEFEDKGMQRHGVHVPTSFYAQFTKDCVALAREQCDGRVISLLEGGYSDSALCSGVMAHLLGLQGCEWRDEYATPSVIRQLEKGCKARWAPPKTVSAKNQSWVVQAIKLGRSLRPPQPEKFATPTSTPAKSSSVTPNTRRILRDRKSTPVYNYDTRRAAASPLASKQTDDLKIISESEPDQLGIPQLEPTSESKSGIPKHKLVQQPDGTWKLADSLAELRL